MGFFNAVRDRFLGKRVEKEAQKSRLQTHQTPYTGLGSYYGSMGTMTDQDRKQMEKKVPKVTNKRR